MKVRMNITEFLEARIAEDEAGAIDAAAMLEGRHWEDDGTSVSSGEDTFWVDGLCVRSPEMVSAHIARHDPARVLAECAAKRAMVQLLGPALNAPLHHVERALSESALKHLAAVYKDHPSYQQEWAL